MNLWSCRMGAGSSSCHQARRRRARADGEAHIMATVRDILGQKGSTRVHTVSKTATVLEGTYLMNDHKIGSLVVLEDGEVVGMFTERDILRRVVGEQRDPARTLVGEVMTTEVFCCTPQTTIDEA